MRIKKEKAQHLVPRNDRIAAYIMMAPFAIFFFMFTVLPVLASVILSTFNYDMITTPSFAGMKNYLRMFISDDLFMTALKNTLLFAIVTGPLGFLLSFILAWMVNEFQPRVRSILSFLFYSPTLAGNAFLVWTVLFSGDRYGYLNSFLLNMGFINEPIQFLLNAKYTMMICIIVQLWMSTGITFLANISGLQNASPQLYEAGALDGIKNRWQELWYITLPSMKSMLLFSSVMQIQSAFSAGNLMVQLTGNPSVEYSTYTIVTHLSDVGGVRYEMGYASAISVFLFSMVAFSRFIIGKLLSATGK